jgi:hypothetical protein
MSRRATDVDRAIARTFAREVETRGGRVALPVDELLAMFEVRRFTDAARGRLGEAIAAAGLVAEPPLREAARGSIITIATRRTLRPPLVTRARSAAVRQWYKRPRAVAAIAVVLLLLLVGALAGDGEPQTTAKTPAPTVTPDPGEQRAEAVAAADEAIVAFDYPAALTAIRRADDADLIDRFKRKIARRVLARARSALNARSYAIAIDRAREARRYGSAAAPGRVIAAAEAGIAARRRAARLARDRRYCDAGERELVRVAGTTPSGCSGYAAELAADRAREAEEAARAAAAVDDNGDGSTENWCGASRDGDGDGLWCEGESPGDSGDSSAAGGSSGNWCGASRDGDGDGIWCEGR